MPIIQVPVVIGEGSKQFLLVTVLTIAPPSPPIYRINNIEKKVIITNCKVIKDKVIINGLVDKNINYKTVEHVHEDENRPVVNGPLYHYTTQIPFSTFVEVPGAMEGDNCEIESAIVEGEKDELMDPNICSNNNDPVTYNKLKEKLVVRIDVKVTRTEKINVESPLTSKIEEI
ncbi:DUF3794 domain-containing protein [Caloranaerobacter azorensis]|uniref:SipL SPOCS domain-containing protein n=2 Tax=Caloranaerobacter azorensis TaxID=116090 RepID=A0A1M5VXG3_9FIRM|nr:DUF3794 domain-containing protein [Caloranaerobacter azorensis]QIB26751.1 DUF3794 domain-containing protein [Caloranaerobacter azorensis]SHH79945.1 protein of unknown function [Caloranaerobacter azorensis DSM 13643]